MRNRVILVAAALSIVACLPDGSESTTSAPATVTAEEAAKPTAETAIPGPPNHTSSSVTPLRELPLPPGGIRMALGSPRERELSAAEYPGHFQNRVVDKPTTRLAGTPPAVPAAYMGKQQQYLEKWKEMRAASAGLSPQEQNKRRAELKRSLLGE